MVFGPATILSHSQNLRNGIWLTKNNSLNTATTTMIVITKDLKFGVNGITACGMEKYAKASAKGEITYIRIR
jgi:hypothetical protein